LAITRVHLRYTLAGVRVIDVPLADCYSGPTRMDATEDAPGSRGGHYETGSVIDGQPDLEAIRPLPPAVGEGWDGGEERRLSAPEILVPVV